MRIYEDGLPRSCSSDPHDLLATRLTRYKLYIADVHTEFLSKKPEQFSIRFAIIRRRRDVDLHAAIVHDPLDLRPLRMRMHADGEGDCTITDKLFDELFQHLLTSEGARAAPEWWHMR